MRTLLFFGLGMAIFGLWWVPTPAKAENPDQIFLKPPQTTLPFPIDNEDEQTEKEREDTFRRWRSSPYSHSRYAPGGSRPIFIDLNSRESPLRNLPRASEKHFQSERTFKNLSKSSPRSGKGGIVALVTGLLMALGALLMAEGVKTGDTFTMMVGLAVIVAAIVGGSWLYRRVKNKGADSSEDTSPEKILQHLDSSATSESSG